MTTCKFSTAPFGLPGRLMISVFLRMPVTILDNMACGVILRLAARMASARPGASRSMTARVASGVTSRGEKPVPPVVRMTSISPLSAQEISISRMADSSSGRSDCLTTDQPSAWIRFASAGPDAVRAFAARRPVREGQDPKPYRHCNSFPNKWIVVHGLPAAVLIIILQLQCYRR